VGTDLHPAEVSDEPDEYGIGVMVADDALSPC